MHFTVFLDFSPLLSFFKGESLDDRDADPFRAPYGIKRYRRRHVIENDMGFLPQFARNTQNGMVVSHCNASPHYLNQLVSESRIQKRLQVIVENLEKHRLTISNTLIQSDF